MHRRLVHDAVLDALQPVIEPAQGFVVVLVAGPVEIDRRPDREALRAFPLFIGAHVSGQVQAEHAPVGAQIRRHLAAGLEIHRAFLPVFVAQRIEQDVHPHGSAAGVRIAQRVHQQRIGDGLGVAQGRLDRRIVFFVAPFLAKRVFDVEKRRLAARPVLHEVRGQDAAAVEDVAIAVGKSVRRKNGALVRGLESRDALGDHGKIGDAVHAHLAAGPRTRGQPFNGFVQIPDGLGIGFKVAKLSAGPPCAADGGDHHDIAAPHVEIEIARFDPAAGVGKPIRHHGHALYFLRIRTGREEHRELSLGVGPVDVGLHGDAVADRDFDVAFDGDAILALGRLPVRGKHENLR